jgi:hypothetical protein
VFGLSPQRASALSHAQVVQSAGYHHRQIGEPIFRIAKHIFDHPRAFHSGDSMFHTHADVRDALILLFFGVG